MQRNLNGWYQILVKNSIDFSIGLTCIFLIMKFVWKNLCVFLVFSQILEFSQTTLTNYKVNNIVNIFLFV